MAEALRDRLQQLLSSDDDALVQQGCELIISLGKPLFFERFLIGARVDEAGQLTPAESLSERATLFLLAHAPSSLELSRDLQRHNIHQLSLSLERLPEVIGAFEQLQRLELTHRSDAPLPDALARLPSLVALRLTAPQLATLPVFDGAFPSLQRLHLCAPLTTLPLPPRLEQLTLERIRLRTLPDALSQLSRLRALAIHGASQLTTLPAALGELSALTTLALTDTKLTTLPDSLARLSSLRHLQISNNPSLSLAPGQLNALSQLEVLELQGTAVHRLPAGLQTLPALQSLSLNDQAIHEQVLALARSGTWSGVDAAIEAMALLAEKAPESLAGLLRGGEQLPNDRLIRGYRFGGTPQAGLDDAWLAGIALLPESRANGLGAQLSRLNLSGGLESNPRPGDLLSTPQPIHLADPLPLLRWLLTPPAAGRPVRQAPGLHRIPRFFDRLQRLERLDLSRNQIIEVSAPLPERMKWLSLADNPLLAFPESLLEMPRLRTLNLTRTRLTSLPLTGWKTSRLTELILSGNALEILPDALDQVRTLSALSLDHNQLAILPDLSRLRRLSWLTLTGNQLSHLPDWLGTLPLTVLLADHNRICTLPDAGDGWSSMTQLSLAGNALLILPSLRHLGRLRTLDLSGNDLVQLPEDLSPLHSLVELELSNNALTRLPESLWYLPQLTTLRLTGNQLSELSWTVRTAPMLRSLDLTDNPLSLSPMLRWMIRRRLGSGALGV